MSSSASRRPSAARLAATLGLGPHPEGGWFRETYRAPHEVWTPRGPRAASTAILFLVTPESPSRFHRLASDELWVFQAGEPLDLVTIEDGRGRHRVLGDAVAGLRAQALVRAGVWQAARVAGTAGVLTTHATARKAAGARAGTDAAAEADTTVDDTTVDDTTVDDTTVDDATPGEGAVWSLVSCVVTPGFADEDFELARRDDLVRRHPHLARLIETLT